MAASNSYIFSSLEKFSDGNGTELNAFLSKFSRCCSVSNKVDAEVPVKGQLLMLFVEGRARAALEEYEISQGGDQQTYVALVAKLKEYFDSTSARETSMHLFDGRIQKVNESEEEFMLHLLRLYQAANPDHAAAVTLLAVKRKFLAGILPSLRNQIFTFCSEPLAAGVSRENLLGFCRQAHNMLGPQQPNAEISADRVLTATNHNHDGLLGGGGTNDLAAAITNLAFQISEDRRVTEMRLDELGSAIAAVSSQNNFRGRGGGRGGRGGGRGNYYNNYNRNNSRGGNNFNAGGNNSRGGFSNGSNRGSRGSRSRGGNRGAIQCYNCNGFNHRSRDCTAPSEN